jgi:hypothetical protein
VRQLRAGFSPWHRQDSASTRSGNVGRPRRRQVCRHATPCATPRVPYALPVPWQRVRPKPPQRCARSAIVLVAATPWTSRPPQCLPCPCQPSGPCPGFGLPGRLGGPRARQRAYHARPCPPVGRGEPRYPARPRSPGQGPTSGTHAAWKRLGWIPGSRGSGRVREFFDEARLKPMSSR